MISFDLEKQFDEYKEAHKLLVMSNRKEHDDKKIEFEKIEQKLFDKIRDLISASVNCDIAFKFELIIASMMRKHHRLDFL